MDAGVDMGVEQVTLAGDLLLPSVVEGSFSVGEDPTLDAFLYDRGPVSANFGYNPDVLKASESIVYKETLG